MTATVDQMVNKYVELRDRRTAMKKEFSEKDGELKALQERIEAHLQVKMDDDGVESFKTPHGTAYATYVESARVGDWEAFFGHVLATKQFDLLKHDVNKTACREHMKPDRNGNYAEPPPPGVDFNRIKKVNVRRS